MFIRRSLAGSEIELELAGRPVSVLSVEDHVAFAYALRALLEQSEELFVIDDVRSAEEAIAHPRLADVDVVLMDISLGRIDGVEATRRLLANDPGLRVVVMSGYGFAERARRALAAGACSYVEKGQLDRTLVETLVTSAGRSTAAESVVGERADRPAR